MIGGNAASSLDIAFTLDRTPWVQLPQLLSASKLLQNGNGVTRVGGNWNVTDDMD